MAEHEDLRGRTLGEFLLRERLDEGGFGTVYRAEQPLLGREAVVKVLHQRLRGNDVVLQRFVREAKLASRLDHPYAAHVYACGIEPDDGLFWIAMERVQGITLDCWLHERGPLPLAQLVPFFDRVAEVVQAAHERGIIHRDIKPSNVMVIERSGRLLPKLLDFGIAKILDEAAPKQIEGSSATDEKPPAATDSESTARLRMRPNAPRPSSPERDPAAVGTMDGSAPGVHYDGRRLTRPGATMGSPPYMSPEQWDNAITVGPASDLYALGVVAYEALTGRRPYSATSIAEYVDMHCNYPVPPLGDTFRPALDRMFQRALAKRPADRWATALELASAFRAASGLAVAAIDLPRLDDDVRDAWLAGAPEPLAESIAALDGARNTHQARDTAQELFRNLLRYLMTLSLTTRAQVRDDRDDPALLEMLRALRRRDLDDRQRVQLIRLLVRPLVARRGAHPIPELVDLVTPDVELGTDAFDPVLALYPTSDQASSEDLVRERLARLLPELARFLRKLAFVLDYAVVVRHNDAAERWMGPRRQARAAASVVTGELVNRHPMLLARDGRVCVDLWPLAQVVSAAPVTGPELFLFDGRGRDGARLISAVAGVEHDDPRVWEWISTRIMAEINREVTGDRPPYLGLTSYAKDDAGHFVGREPEVEVFLRRLHRQPLQIVVGPSGAGKSSFVHAGVLPALPGSWRTITLRPGASPLAALAAQLTAARITTADLRPVLENSPDAAVALLVHAAAGRTILIVIDQLEELFTLCPRAAERTQFAAALAALTASAEVPIRVVGVIRDDFLMQLEALPALRPLLSAALMLLGNPSRDTLMRIVTEPARRAGYSLSDLELAHDMVNVVVDRPGALALLSFTAAQLWELRDRRFHQLTRSAYEAMGGVAGALGRHAETTLAELSAEEQRLARDLFRHLVTPEGTRRRTTHKELRQRLTTTRSNALIDKLVTARLVTVSESDGEAHVEVIHDALIGAWPRLQQWVREDVEGARMREQLRQAARHWQDRARPASLLWRDGELADLERLLGRHGAAPLAEIEAAFVEASRRDERARAEARRRHARRTTWGRRGLAAAAVAISLGGVQYRATVQQRAAEQETLSVRQIAEVSTTVAEVEQGRSALLHDETAEAQLHLGRAYERGDRSSGVAFMLARALQPRLAEQARFASTAGRMWSATFSPDGHQIVTTDDKNAQVWDAQTNARLFTLPHGAEVYQATYSSDGTKLVTVAADVVRIWNPMSGTLVRELRQNRADAKPRDYFVAALSSRGDRVAAIDAEGAAAHVWDANTGTSLAEIPNAALEFPSLAFSADGRWLATSGGDDVRVFDTSTWKRAMTIAGPHVRGLSFDPTGARLLTGAADGDASIWDVPSGARVRHLREIGEPVDRVAFSPDGALVVAAARDGAEQVWKVATGAPQSHFNQIRGRIHSIEFDPTSQLVVAAGANGAVVVSDAALGMPVAVIEGPKNVVRVSHFDPSSRRVVAASWDGTARVWDATSPYRRWRSPPISDDCGLVTSLEPDRRFLAIGCRDLSTRILDTASDRLVVELPSVTRVEGDFASAFPAVSLAGDRAAIARGTTVELYELPAGTLIRTIRHHAAVNAVAFAATGHDLVSGAVDGSLLVTRDDSEPIALPGSSAGIDAAAILVDGRVVAAAGKRLRVYSVERGDVLADLELAARVRTLRPSADGLRVITVPGYMDKDPPALWDLEHFRLLATLEGHDGRVFSARFVGDGSVIVTAGGDGVARLWNGTTGELRQTYQGSSRFLADATVTPDGSMVVAGDGDGVLRFWEATNARPLWTLRAHKSHLVGVHFEGYDIVTRGFGGDVSRWTLPNARAVIETCGAAKPCVIVPR